MSIETINGQTDSVLRYLISVRVHFSYVFLQLAKRLG